MGRETNKMEGRRGHPFVTDRQQLDQKALACLPISHTCSRASVMMLAVVLVLIPTAHGQAGGGAQGPNTPPPQIGDKPIVANGIVYYLKTVPNHCLLPYVSTFPSGGLVYGKRAMMKSDNPHVVNGNIEIPPNACLYIEPGVVMRFGPGFGIIVNGTLIARGSEEPGGRIVMTKDKGEDIGRPSGEYYENARLSGGNTTRDGRLDLMYRGKWRSICTNYQNFTLIDVNVTCRHLGFLKGNFTYHSFSRNLTDYMLWEKPDCRGTENSLFDCPGASRMHIGAHICDGQQVVGFECEGLRPGIALDHWRGIEFLNSTSRKVSYDGNILIEESYSWLEYVDILYPGLDTFHGRTQELDIFYPKAAISASPLVPLMNNVTIMYGAYDAFNLTEITGNIHIANCTIHKNRGYGIFIQTAVGQSLINTTTVTENWGDGIKFYISNLTINDFSRNFTWDQSFCKRANLDSQNYPVFEYQDVIGPEGQKNPGTSCQRSFSTTDWKSVNLHFLIMERDPEARGKLKIKEGKFGTGDVIGEFDISNGSFPQSVRTQTKSMTVTFEYKLPQLAPGQKCKTFPPCIRFLLRFTTPIANETDDEFRLINSKVSENNGYGVNIQDMRSRVFINSTEVIGNGFGAGIRVYQGAGEVIINNTLVENNKDAGINITYSGGYQLLNNTQLVRNRGYGVITEYLRLNRTRFESMFKMEVVRGVFLFNEFIGLRVGNYCLGGSVLVNESRFAYNLDEAIEYLSCNISAPKPTNFSVAYTDFKGNIRHAILMKPLLNTVGIITNCTFTNHTLGTLRIDNSYDLLINKWYRNFRVDYQIFDNRFYENFGRYVVSLRLTDGAAYQKLLFKFNRLRDNVIQDSFPYINPRAQANAVAVVSSGNVVFMRNTISNHGSVRELATHLINPAVVIDATENFWDIEIVKQSDFDKVHRNIFDQDDRYNLALIKYYPALKTNQVYDADDRVLTKDVAEYEWSFSRDRNIIGGVLRHDSFRALEGTTYYVDRDIFVLPGFQIILGRRVTLKFASSVGMVVHGCLKADGQNSAGTIRFELWEDPDILPLENRTATVRLSNGSDLYEGRLEVFINDEWGTVCNEGWTVENAAMVCRQLGLIYNPDQGTASLKVVAPPETRVLMSWVTCDEVDDDLTKCRTVRPPDIICGHDRDVYLRCQDPTWAGITLPATPRLSQACDSQIRAVHLERAGLLDAASMSFTPALRIDYNYYIITELTVTNSLSDAVLINYNHPYETARLEYIQLHNNKGHGVVTRFPRLELLHSNITGSGKAGFQYDPFFSEYDALIVHSSIDKSRRSLIEVTPNLPIGRGGMTFLLCSPGQAEETRDYTTEITTDYSTYRIVLQMLDYFPVTDIEQITVYDSPRQNIGGSTRRWVIPQDLVDFPIISTSNVLTVQLTVRGLRSGRMAFAVLSQISTSGSPVLTTYVHNTTFTRNYQGMQTKHYNSPTNRRLEIFHRFKLETIKFDRVNILSSAREAIHMPSVTKFTDDYIPTYEDMTVPERVATIRYNISLAKFADNEIGILAEHNHVDFANNVWQWLITNSEMVGTRNGGLVIEVPRVNDAIERKSHSVFIQESQFRDNSNFGCTIAGYYAQVSVENNLFENNRCLVGLFTMSGMEKNMSFVNNRIRNNVGRHMVDINVVSHSEYSQSVIGVMRLNDIQNNRYEGLDPPGYGNSPKTFAVAFQGIQDMVANRNIFNNPRLAYEVVAGIMSLSLMNPVNVKENFWGRTDYGGILDRIFDFDDWNNYVIAEFFPYLTRADVNSDTSKGEIIKPPLNTNELGGRVLENQILAYKSTPYIVQSDLTVMPGVTLTISAGVQLQFRPNIGILVLGRLVAKGMEYNRIKMRPIQTLDQPGKRKKRAASATIRLRGDGTLFKDSGFLEFYNSSTKSWNMMCDSQFNRKSAEVVCRQLGKETINVRVRFTYLYDFYIYGAPQYFLKEFWFESYYCRGDETSLAQCITRYNYNMQQCIKAANYTFIACGERNLPPGQEYWGNIRFASKSFQEQPLEDDKGRDESILEYIDIEGAGWLHGEKVGAVQTTYVTPKMNFINVTKCAENGFDIIAPRSILEMHRVNVSNNLGYGYNFLILNGESSGRDSSFSLLGESTIPYNVYGLVEICRMEKRIDLNTRMILYYKYGPDNRDCVKIIRSTSVRGRIGVRFLQINMFHEDFSRNVVEIFDGSEINPNSLMAEILSNTSKTDIGQLYQSTGDTLTVHIHASVSHGSYGFIAEVVTVPLSGLTYPDSTYQHSVTQSIARGNQDGALQYKNVGEINPSFYVDNCWLEDNGVAILNLTSPPIIDISLQGTLLFRFASNFVSRNKGGMYVSLHTNSIATAMKGNITNNIFSFGTNGEALNITGHYYQKLYMFQNYIFNYTSGDYRDVVHIRDVVVNYTYNYLDNNTGHYILTAYNSDNRQARQEYTRSGFIRNNSTALVESTIKIGRGLPFFENNYIVNDENDFEIETYPKLDSADQAIDARNNWWGSDLRSYINGKMWENSDNEKLVSVNFWQPKFDNRSVVEGICQPGWKLDSGRCYRFMGGALPYHDANKFCQSVGAFLAEGKGREGFYNYLLRLMRNLNDPASRVWVMSEVGTGRCTALEHTYLVYEEDCWNILYPFICEKDPYLVPPPGLESSVKAMAIGIGAGIGGALALVAIILGVLWCVKSKRREKERFERTMSIRESVRSSMRGSKSTLTILSEGRSRRRLNEIDGYSQGSSMGAKMSQGTMEDLNGSMASLHSGYRNGRAVLDRRGEDQRGTERNGWQNPVERYQEWGVDREADRGNRRFQQRGFGRDVNRGDRGEKGQGERGQGSGMERGRRYHQEEDDKESSAGSCDKEACESEDEKKGMDDTEEEDDSFDSDPDVENAASKSTEHLYQNNNRNTYQNNYQPGPLPGMGDGIRRARSRDDVYENEYVQSSPQKSKSLSSFSQPDSPDESPVKSIFLPRRQDLPTPPPTPRTLARAAASRPQPPAQDSWRPQPAPKPQPLTHPAVEQFRPSPASSNASSARPAPVPRKQVPGSHDSSPRATPPLHGHRNYQDYDSQVSPLPAKQAFGSQDSVSRASPQTPASNWQDEYKPHTPTGNPAQRLPNLPRYSLPLPMDSPPSYDEGGYYPDYSADRAPEPYHPSQEPPSQDVQYFPRQPQPDRRQFHGSRDRLAIAGSRERLNSPGVLFLNNGGSSQGSSKQDHLETEI